MGYWNDFSLKGLDFVQIYSFFNAICVFHVYKIKSQFQCDYLWKNMQIVLQTK